MKDLTYEQKSEEVMKWTSKEGPLAAYKGETISGPDWFERALAQKPIESDVDVKGTAIRTYSWGDKGKPGLLLAHGNGAHGNWWDFVAPYLAREYHVIAYDLGGMGNSGWYPEYSLEQYANEQMAICEDAGWFDMSEPPIIVGHSFGGFVSIVTGARFGSSLAGTVIVDSPVNPPERQKKRPDFGGRPHKIYPKLEDALARFRLAPEQTCENHYIIDYIGRRSLKEVEGGWTWKFDPGIWHKFSIDETSHLLQATKCRIGIIRGERSALLTPDVGDYMYGLLGRSVPVIEIPEAQHHIWLDQPLSFVSALRALLADWEHSHPERRGQ